MPYAWERMLERIKKSKYKKIFAVILIVYGVIALLLPGLPGAWFIFIGLEIFGIRLLCGERIKAWWKNRKARPDERALESQEEEPPR
jgi:hypothetical protein